MSSQCNYFVQNAWKKELCSNCFKPREEHSEVNDNNARLNSARVTTMTTKTRNVETKPQGILKGRTSSKGKKKVAFPDSLTEVIGYGGDDFSDSEEFELNESLSVEDELPDGEEERALCNLTRANTSFNTVTANLSSNSVTDSKKSFASLMLGKPRKDSDGKKKTLLVSVTPFGADTNVPSAKRPSERKATTTFSNFANFGKTNTEVVAETKSEVCTLKSVNNITEDKILRDRSEKESHDEQVSSLEKIVDMPLITSSNLISVIQKSDSLTNDTTIGARVTESYQKSGGESLKASSKPGAERKVGITRTPAIKKQKDVEKPKILSLQANYKQTLNNKNEYIARTNARENETYSRIDENDMKSDMKGMPLGVLQERNTENRERTWSSTRGKEQEISSTTVPAAQENDSTKDVGIDADPTFSSQVSRELAGEPDGKADEEMVEPPALPRSPPPVEPRISPSEPRNSFLHNVEKKNKPAVPLKPMSLPPKGPGGFRNLSISAISAATRISRRESQEEKVTPALIAPTLKTPPVHHAGAIKDDDEEEEDDGTLDVPTDAETELVRSPNKRRMAPKPPPPTYTGVDEVGGSLFARNPGGVNLKSDSPVVREKEKRERASSCSPKFRKDSDIDGSEATEPVVSTSVPEPAPRRIISLSQDSLLANADKTEEKKKARSRFSLKKFLRMGSKKDQVDGSSSVGPRIDELPNSPHPTSKPRLEIIHPLELDGAAVEVVSREKISRLNDDAKHDAPEIHEQSPNVLAISTSPNHHPFARPGKPPPPPRNQSLDDWARLDPANKPARPPPPRTEIKSPTKSWHPPSPTSPDSIYANLAAEDVPGEVRSCLAPSKPQRTASMRDQAISQPPVKKRPTERIPRHQDYEAVGGPLSGKTESPNMSNESHAYECLSSSPECDSSLDLRHGAASRDGTFQINGKRKSDSSALDPGTVFKYNQQPFTRSTSLPYCGSETESELYSPYSFYTGDEGPEEDQDWKNSKEQESRGGRLRQRRGRSIVHRSLEDNYGAVIVANHEALAQVLEQLNQNTGIPPALRDLKTANHRLSDFKLDPNTWLPLGRRIFYDATWNESAVTICIALDLALHVSRKDFNLVPITEFTDTMPDFVAEKMHCGEKKNVEATISVFPHLQVTTINAFGTTLKEASDEGFVREASFVLLQLVNAFKTLQARGVKEAPKNLNNTILCRENRDACYRLYLLQSLSSDVKEEWEPERSSLCKCVLEALGELKLSQKLPLVQELLERDRPSSLSQVKSVLEFSLWGPADVPLGGSRDREMTLQRWLDLERATVLHALVRAKAPLAVTDEYHSLFLVKTSAKIMCEASILLDAQRRK